VVRTVGLTGGIGTGKSTVSGLLRGLGATVVDADEATRAVQVRGSDGLRQLVEAFGPGILTAEGDLDRAALADLAFGDERARERLNAIVHPLVRRWMAERVAEAAGRGDPLVVLDVPLLFESRGTAGMDAVVLVYAPEAVQLRRLVELRGMSEERARARIAAQMPIEEKRRLATHVVDNTGSLDELRRHVERLWADLSSPSPESPSPPAGEGD
jgi:dephospho-CoA kinase